MGSSDRGWRLYSLVIDAVDLDAAVSFWSGLLGLAETHRFEQYALLEEIAPGTRLTIQQVDSITADKSPIHFDLAPADFDEFVARVEELGGRLLRIINHPQYDLVVMTDVSGNEFCVNQRTSIPRGRAEDHTRHG